MKLTGAHLKRGVMRNGDGGKLLIQLKRIGATAVVAAFLFWPLPVTAQTALEDSIANRTGPHTQPIGMVVGPYGSFLLFPKFVLDTEFTDNLFSVDSGKSADVAFVFKPSFEVSSDWDNHSLKFTARAAQSKYIDNIEENSLDYGFEIGGQLDALEKSNLTASLIFDKKHQGRGDPNDDVAGVFEEELTNFNTLTVKFGGLYNEDAILVKLDVKADSIDYDDAGTTDNDDRDLVKLKTTARLGYEWVPGSTAFVETSYDLRHFDKAVDNAGFKRSSRGFEILLGNTLDLTSVTFAELGIGFIRQTFGSQPTGIPNIGPTQGISFKGSLVWNPTDLITITGNLRRQVNETTIPGAASAFTSSFELKADYGLLEELLLSAGAKLNLETFDGIDRMDKSLKIDLGGKYYIGPHFIAAAKYTYEERFADDPGGSFVNNSFILSLTARF